MSINGCEHEMTWCVLCKRSITVISLDHPVLVELVAAAEAASTQLYFSIRGWSQSRLDAALAAARAAGIKPEKRP